MPEKVSAFVFQRHTFDPQGFAGLAEFTGHLLRNKSGTYTVSISFNKSG